MAVALKKRDSIVSVTDLDKGKVAAYSGARKRSVLVNLFSNSDVAVSRHKTTLYRRNGSKDREWGVEVLSESAEISFYYRIRRVEVNGCENETDSARYYWMITSTRRYRPDGTHYYLGNDDQKLVCLVVNGDVVHRRDLRFIIPPEGPPPGFEELTLPENYDDD